MLSRNVESFIGCIEDYQSASLVVFGAPYDATTSYRPGARFGSRAIRSESYGIETYSPYQDRDMGDIAVFDSGDLELCFGDTQGALEMIQLRAETIYGDGKRPVMLGGEHLVTLGVVRSAVKRYPTAHIIHFDAHADLREDYLGQRLSHACVMRRCWEEVGDGRIWQFGIRSGDREEFVWAGQGHVHMNLFDFHSLEYAVDQIGGMPVYLSIDLDILDPSAFPGTGTPEAGGVSFAALLDAVIWVCKSLTVIGADLCELSPIYDPSGASTAMACKLLRELLLAIG